MYLYFFYPFHLHLVSKCVVSDGAWLRWHICLDEFTLSVPVKLENIMQPNVLPFLNWLLDKCHVTSRLVQLNHYIGNSSEFHLCCTEEAKSYIFGENWDWVSCSVVWSLMSTRAREKQHILVLLTLSSQYTLCSW